MSRQFTRFLVVSFSLCFLAGCSTPLASPAATPTATAKPATLQIGLVTDVGGLHDRSFNQLAYEGLEESAAKYGVKYTAIQSKSQDDYIRNLTRFVTQRAALIVAV